MSNNKFGLKNFRVFDDNGAEFEIAPITILTGCNSSGKSSIIKAMMLLNNFFEQIMVDFKKGNVQALDNYHLNFINEIHNLGLFANAKNKFSKTDVITFSFSKFSFLINSDLYISISFVNDKDSKTQSGKLQAIIINHDNIEVIKYEAANHNTKINMQVLKGLFFDFAEQAKEYNRHQKLISEFEIINGSWLDNLDNIEDYDSKKDEYLQKNIIEENNFKNFDHFLHSDLVLSNPRNYKEIFNRECEFNSLFYLPIIDLLNTVDKDTIEIRIKHLFEQYNVNDTFILNQMNKIIADFKVSGFDYIIDYYLYYENLFLEKIQYNDKKGMPLTYLGQFFKGIYSDTEILNLRLLTLTVNSDWEVGTGTDSEAVWEKIGGEDFDKEERKFKQIFQTLQNLNIIINEQYKNENTIVELHGGIDKRAKDFETFILYISCILHDGLLNTPTFIKDAHFIGAERVNLQRLYTKDNNTEFTKTLFDLMHALDKYKIDRYKPLTFVKKWLGKDKFDIAEDLEIKVVEEGLGVFVRLKKRGEWGVLADEGFGVSKLLSILFKIELLIIQEQIRYMSVRKGIEKERLLTQELSTIIIEEPESNLHPKFQSLLADLFVELAFNNKNESGLPKVLNDERILNGFNFIIETHSEYLIRKLQYLTAKREILPDNSIIHYISEGQVRTINIKPNGQLTKPFGSGFTDESSRWIKEMFMFYNQN